MFAAIFEVQPKQGKFDEYLSLAKYLRPKLERIDGFIDVDRFASKRMPARILSLSTWRDEKSVVRWRTQSDHQAVQEKGRFEIFEDYHLRIGEVISDTAPPEGLAVVEQRLDLSADAEGLIEQDALGSLYHPGKLMLVAAWRDVARARSWCPTAPVGASWIRHRSVRVIRDYGMFDRREAPQFYPEVERGAV